MIRTFTSKLSAISTNLLFKAKCFFTRTAFIAMLLVLTAPYKLFAQAPTIGYSGAQTYIAGKAIAPLAPSSSGVAAAGYSNTPLVLGSGFNYLTGIAVDAGGNVYISDAGNNVIQKIPKGNGNVVTIGSGLNSPDGLAIDAAGNVYVVDRPSGSVKKIPAGGGTPVTIASGFTRSGAITADLGAITADAAGNVFVADNLQGLVFKIPAGGGAAFPINPFLAGLIFTNLSGLAVDVSGNLYGSSDNRIYKLVTGGGGNMISVGTGLNSPKGIALDAGNNIYVSDQGNGVIKRISADGSSTVTLASGLFYPTSIAVDGTGNIFVTNVDNSGNNMVNEIKPVGGYYISPSLPAGLSFSNSTGVISGTPTSASPATKYTITVYNGSVSSSATVSIAVQANLPSISYSGPQSFVAGTAIKPIAPVSSGVSAAGYSLPATAYGGFYFYRGMCMDAQDNLYVADFNTNVITKLPAAGGPPVVIGSGYVGLTGVAADAFGNIYAADGAGKAVWKIPKTGNPITIGTGIFGPKAIAADHSGNVYVSGVDSVGEKIRKISPNGVTTVALYVGVKLGISGMVCDGAGNLYLAQGDQIIEIPVGQTSPVTIRSGFSGISAITMDAAGNIYITDNICVYKVPADHSPTIPLVPGLSYHNPATAGIAVSASGDVYTTDYYVNNSIVEYKPSGGYYINPALPDGLIFDSNTGIISGTPTGANGPSPAANYTVTAYGSGGSASATLSVQVTSRPLPAIAYNGPQTYSAGVAITPLAPASSGVAAAQYNLNGYYLPKAIGVPNGFAIDHSGNMYLSDQSRNALYKIPAGGGNPVNISSGFSQPAGIATDAAGNIYVADISLGVIKMIPAANGPPVTVATGFNMPNSVALDAAGNIYVADQTNAYKIPAGGNTPVIIATGFYDYDGVSQGNQITVDAAGNVYVSNVSNNIIYKVPAGGGGKIAFGFAKVSGMVAGGSGNLYITGSITNPGPGVMIISSKGGNPSMLVQSGPDDLEPSRITIDAAGNIYVISSVSKYIITHYGGLLSTAIFQIKPVGGYSLDKPLPAGLTFDGAAGIISGTPIVASPATNYKITGYNVAGSATATVNISVKTTVLPPPVISYNGQQKYTVNVPISPVVPASSGVSVLAYNVAPVTVASGFNNPQLMAADIAGNIYVADYANNMVKKIPAGGGVPVAIGSGFNGPTAVAVDGAGNVYVTDDGTLSVKKIPANGGATITIASGLVDKLNYRAVSLLGIATDASGDVYVSYITSDGLNYQGSAVLKIQAGGGTPVILDGTGNGSAIALDADGNIYGTGQGIINMAPAGGGSPVTIASGLNSPAGITLDGAGNIYFSDFNNGAVYKIPAGGGTPVPVVTGLSTPGGIAIDKAGNLYVTDSNNNLINEIKPAGGYFVSPGLPPGLSFDGTTGIISGTPTAASPLTNYTITAYNLGGKATSIVGMQITLPPLPTISYSSSQTYTAGTAISPLVPQSTNVGAPSYSAPPVTLLKNSSGFGAIALDASRNMFVADSAGLEKIPAGGGAPIFLAKGTSPKGNSVGAITVDAAGNVYYTDPGSYTLIKIPVGGGPSVKLVHSGNAVAIDLAGNVYTQSGNGGVEEIPAAGGSAYSIGSGVGDFDLLAADAYGNLYGADWVDSLVYKIPVDGSGKVTLASGLNSLSGIAVDNSGNIFVTQNSSYPIVNALKEIPAGGSDPISIASGNFNGIVKVALDAVGNLYVTDNHTISVNYVTGASKIDGYIKQIKPTGGYYISPALPAGLSFDNKTGTISGTPTVASASKNYTVTAYNSAGFATATVNIKTTLPPLPVINYNTPQKYTLGNAIQPLVPANTGMGAAGYSSPAAVGTGFIKPTSVAVDASGNVYVVDSTSYAFKKIPAGGGPVISISTPGIAAPNCVAVDRAGNIYIGGAGEVTKIPANGGAPVIVGQQVYAKAMAVDSKGNIYVADDGFRAVYKIPAGGGAAAVIATGFTPVGIAVDGADNVYIADETNNAIKEIPAAGGLPILIAGSFPGFSGIAIDAAGNFYVTDTTIGYNPVAYVRKIPANGGAPIFLGLNFSSPEGIAVSANGSVYVADEGRNTVQKIKPTGGYSIGPALPAGLSFDPLTGIISGTPTAISPASNYSIAGSNNGGATTAIISIQIIPVPSSNANLANLSPASGTLTPAFATATYSYNESVSNAISSLTFRPTASDTTATIKINGATVKSGNASVAIPLNAGSNMITVLVTAQDGTTKQSYTVNVTRAAASSNAALGSLAISTGTLGPVFSATTTGYTASVSNATTSITITPTTSDPNATVKVNGAAVTSGSASSAIPLTVGTNPITVLVTAQDKTTTQTYTINVTRAASSNATLGSLTISNGSLGTVFSPATSGYTASVGNAVSSITITPATGDPNATVKVNGTAVTSGGTSSGIPLNVGSNTIAVLVTAQDGTTKLYTISVTRATSSNTDLASLAINNGTLAPVFTAATTGYNVSVGNTVSSIAITPATSDANATVKINGTAVTSGSASSAVPLNVGANTVTVLVTAQDGTTKTYTISVTRAASSNADLANLAINNGSLAPTFAAATTGYTVSVGNAVSSIAITPVVSDVNASIMINGAAVASGSASAAIMLNVGVNAIGILVTAQDGTTKTYTINVTRAEPAIFSLPGNNFALLATSATCKGVADGSINIAAAQNLNYVAAVTFNGTANSYSFNTTQAINNLAAGTYHICITVQGDANYQQCFDIAITEPKDLAVYSVINNTDKTVSLSLSGGTLYTIQLNGTNYTTSANSITLPLQEGNNPLVVTTDRMCQGSYKTVINILKAIIPFPDPFESEISVDLGTQKIANAYFEVHSIGDGQLVYAKQFFNQSGVVQLELNGLKQGVYALHITLDNTEKIFKIIRK